MIRLGRLLLLLILVTGVVVGAVRLKSLGVPAIDVLVTGLLVVLGLVALFALLLGAGKLLGWLTRR